MPETITISGVTLELPPDCERWLRIDDPYGRQRLEACIHSLWYPVAYTKRNQRLDFVAARAALAWRREAKKMELDANFSSAWHYEIKAETWESLVPEDAT